jgi:hypothetical protein
MQIHPRTHKIHSSADRLVYVRDRQLADLITSLDEAADAISVCAFEGLPVKAGEAICAALSDVTIFLRDLRDRGMRVS